VKKNSRTARNLFTSLSLSSIFIAFPPVFSHHSISFYFSILPSLAQFAERKKQKTFLTFNFIVVSLNSLASFAVYFWKNCPCVDVCIVVDGFGSVHKNKKQMYQM
jgi:uncharacterized membrane protein